MAKFANSTIYQLWLASPLKNKMRVGKYLLDCSDDLMRTRYTDDKTKKFDGVHMYGYFGRRAFTRSLTRILCSTITEPTNVSNQSAEEPQTHGQQQPGHHPSVKDSNRFHVLTSISENH